MLPNAVDGDEIRKLHWVASRPLDGLRSLSKSMLAGRRLGPTCVMGAPASGRPSGPTCSFEEMEMRTAYDFSPLYRSVIGVDRMADLIETAMRSGGDSNYPPYDIEKTGEDSYRITLAAAGFSPDELELTAQPNLLIVAGRKAKDDESRNYLHRGIAGRSFERRFELADYVVVKAAD